MSPVATEVVHRQTATDLVAVERLSVTYGDASGMVPVLREVSLAIQSGETLALVGESGSGKSTLARALVRLLPRSGRITGGSIRFEGREVTAMSGRELEAMRGARVGFVFQDPDTYLNPLFRVGRQIADVIILHQGLSQSAAWRLGEQQLARVDIRDPAHVMQAYPHQLSGGMRQRVLMAMATSCGPALLIADEPTTALDVLVQRQVLATLAHLKRDSGMAVLLVTHDLGLVAENADRVAVMYAGSIVESGSAARIFGAPAHPYTQGLMAAARPAGRRFATLAGSPPDLRGLAPGCPFAPRCERAQARCGVDMPVLTARAGGAIACFNPVP